MGNKSQKMMSREDIQLRNKVRKALKPIMAKIGGLRGEKKLRAAETKKHVAALLRAMRKSVRETDAKIAELTKEAGVIQKQCPHTYVFNTYERSVEHTWHAIRRTDGKCTNCGKKTTKKRTVSYAYSEY